MIDLDSALSRFRGPQVAEERASIGLMQLARRRTILPSRDLTVRRTSRRGGSYREDEALYETPRIVIDGMLVNLQEAYWSSSLAGAMTRTISITSN